MEYLARATGFHDPSCVEMFRKGGPICGILPCSGNGTKLDESPRVDSSVLLRGRCETNTALIQSLRTDKHSRVSLEKAKEDAKKGRMSMPRKIFAADLKSSVLSPRFIVEQGAFSDSLSC